MAVAVFDITKSTPSFWSDMKSIFLASGSPRRTALLQLLQRPFQVLNPDIEEVQQPTEAAHQYVTRLAKAKAHAGLALLDAEQRTDALVIGADTVVVVDGEVMEKPRDETDFMRMFKRLSGRVHQVLTAVAVVSAEGEAMDRVTTEVHFCTISEGEARAYWQTGEPCDKAGGYAIQGYAGKFVTSLKGSYPAVVGLPLFETEQLLLRMLASPAQHSELR